MKMNVSDILKTEGASKEIAFCQDFKDLNSMMDGEIKFDRPFDFNGTLTHISAMIKLEGTLQVHYVLQCYRCLKEIEDNMSIPISECFIHENNRTDSDDYTYGGNVVEIEKAIIDNIVLNLPLQQACSEDCKGFCPRCGANLNEIQCCCTDNEINPQMEVLKNLLKG